MQRGATRTLAGAAGPASPPAVTAEAPGRLRSLASLDSPASPAATALAEAVARQPRPSSPGRSPSPTRQKSRPAPPKEEHFGAPVPSGVNAEDMALTTAEDLRVAFEMLETESGVLNRVQARSWLRCAGWCVEDSELDQMLDTASVPRGKTRAGTPVERTRWGLKQLMEVLEAERRSGRRNPGVPDLQAALRRLAGDRPKISHQQLRELTLEAEGLTEADLSQVLHTLGLDDAKHISIDVLAQRLVSKMVEPPSAMELHELVNSKNWMKRAR